MLGRVEAESNQDEREDDEDKTVTQDARDDGVQHDYLPPLIASRIL